MLELLLCSVVDTAQSIDSEEEGCQDKTMEVMGVGLLYQSCGVVVTVVKS